MSAAELEAAKDEIAKLRAEVERLKSGEPPADLWMRSGGKRVHLGAALFLVSQIYE